VMRELKGSTGVPQSSEPVDDNLSPSRGPDRAPSTGTDVDTVDDDLSPLRGDS